MPDTALLELHYLPSIEYFCCIQQYDDIVIERYEHFQKQTYRNRCQILSANKVDTLSIPVKNGNSKIAIKDAEIDYDQRWSSIHWQAIQSAYGKAPFFEFFADYFEKDFQKRERFLFDHNYQLLTTCLKLLNLQVDISFSKSHEKATDSLTDDLRSCIHPKINFNSRQFYRPHSYVQIFGKDFVPNLSVIDLLMCEGPNSAHIVAQSTCKE